MSGPAGTRQGLASVLALYRSVVRVHRERLPPQMRTLGDSLAKSEFRSVIKSPKTTEKQWAAFYSEWRDYVMLLRGEAGDATSAATQSLQASLDALSDDQRGRLDQLKSELQASLQTNSSDTPQRPG